MDTKCGHKNCHCIVDGAEFCGPYCQEREMDLSVPVLPDEPCRCGHAACVQPEE